jgi:transcriptional regulator with XRE-family HTH domain
MDKPPARPESALIRLAREAAGISIPEAAAASGVSKARWSQIEAGYETRGDIVRPVQAKAATLARMAHVAGLTPERLAGEGQRPDAADVLAEILRQDRDDRGGVLPAAAPEWRPPVLPAKGVTAAVITAAAPRMRAILARLRELQDQGHADPSGHAMFPRWRQDTGEAEKAGGWNVARTQTADPEERAWLLALTLVLMDAERAVGNEGTALTAVTALPQARF